MTSRLYLRQPVLFDSDEVELTAFTGRKGTPFFDGNSSLIELGMRYNEGEASQGEFVFLTPGAVPAEPEFETSFPLGHELITWTEDAPGAEVWLFRGRVADSDGSRGVTKIDDETEWHVTVDDGNVDLRGQAFTDPWARPEETDIERLVALQLYTLNGASSTATHHRDTCTVIVNTSHLAPNANTVTMPAKKYPAGTQPADVVRDCADTAGKYWGVVIHHTGGSHLCLLYIVNADHTTYLSPVKISDELADWDPDDGSAPVFEPHWERGAGTIFGMQTLLSGMVGVWGSQETGVFVEYGGGAVADNYDYWVEAYHDSTSTTAGQAANRTAGILEGRRQTNVTHKASLIIGADQVDLIGAGMSLQIKSVVMGTPDAYVTRRIGECRFEPRLDGRYWAHLDIERPPLRVAPGRGRVGPIPPVQSEPPSGETSDILFTFDDSDMKDVTHTYPAGPKWEPGAIFAGTLNPAVGNYSEATHPSVGAGTYTFRAIIGNSRSGGNPGGVELQLYEDSSGSFVLYWTSPTVVTSAPTEVSTSLVVPSTAAIAFKIPHSRCYIYEVEVTHGGTTPGFVGTSVPPAASNSVGAVGTSAVYAPIDHQHPVQTAFVTPIEDAGELFAASFNVEDALQAAIQKTRLSLVNRSGGEVVAGDVVIMDPAHSDSFVTTTDGDLEEVIGIASATIADTEVGPIQVQGYAPLVNVTASVSRGDFLTTSTTVKKADGNVGRVSGSFAQVLTGGTTPTAYLFGTGDPAAGASSSTGGVLPLTAVDGGVPDLVWDDDNSLIATEAL